VKFTLIALLSTLSFLPAATYAASPKCDTKPTDQAQVTETLRTMYAALTTDDLAKFHSVAASDFYAFDGGKRFNGDALIDLIKTAHATGKVYVWTVAEPEVQVICNTAWITYTNRGSMQDMSKKEDAPPKRDLTWLESAVLERQAGVWRIRFFHSTPVR
jgi:hypothetical protein